MMKILLLSIFFLFSCSRMTINTPQEAMRFLEQDKSQMIYDDLDFESLKVALSKSIDYFKKNPEANLTFGPAVIKAQAYIDRLEQLLRITSKEEFITVLKENFNLYEVYGKDAYGEILLTSYYEPVIEGSNKPTSRFNQPLYKLPDDLVEVSLTEYRKINTPGLSGTKGKISGRIESRAGYPNRVVPYYTRVEIDKEKKLSGKNLEMFWVDPLDAFFLQIQGSGTVKVDGNEYRVGYAGQNGREYISIGKHLTDAIPKEEMSLQRIELHLRSLSREEMDKILYLNPSYVFFKQLEHNPLTTTGAEAIAGRTLAVDDGLFPLGALALLKLKKPVIVNEKIEFSEDEEISRFVFAHDTGGAIKGPGRADLFWGRGDEAKLYAGHLRHTANLYFLVPKE